jgi:hypothetical protein
MDIQQHLKKLEAKIARSRRFRLLKDRRLKQMANTRNINSPFLNPLNVSSQCVNSVYQEQLFKPIKRGRPRKIFSSAPASSSTMLQHKENNSVQSISSENVIGIFQTITLFIFNHNYYHHVIIFILLLFL